MKIFEQIAKSLVYIGALFLFIYFQSNSDEEFLENALRISFSMLLIFTIAWILLRLFSGSWGLPKYNHSISEEDYDKNKISFLRYSFKLWGVAAIVSLFSFAIIWLVLGRVYFGNFSFINNLF